MQNTSSASELINILEKELGKSNNGAWQLILNAILNNFIEIKAIEKLGVDLDYLKKSDGSDLFNTMRTNLEKDIRGLRDSFYLNENPPVPSWAKHIIFDKDQFINWLQNLKQANNQKVEMPNIKQLDKTKTPLGRPTRKQEMIEALNRLYPNLDNLPRRKIMHEVVCAYLGQVVLEVGLYSFNAFKNALTDWKKSKRVK